MTNVWLTADTHFGHRNIIKYCNRPWETSEEMDAALFKNWNDTIKQNEVVYFLGDLTLSSNPEIIKSILSRLNGIKYLIKGNHDRLTNQQYRDCGFKEVYDYPIIYKEFFILSHAPVFMDDTMPYVNIHGHTHQNNQPNKKCFNVSVENIGYKPIDIKQIIKHFEQFDKIQNEHQSSETIETPNEN